MSVCVGVGGERDRWDLKFFKVLTPALNALCVFAFIVSACTGMLLFHCIIFVVMIYQHDKWKKKSSAI